MRTLAFNDLIFFKKFFIDIFIFIEILPKFLWKYFINITLLT